MFDLTHKKGMQVNPRETQLLTWPGGQRTNAENRHRWLRRGKWACSQIVLLGKAFVISVEVLKCTYSWT